MVIFYVSPDPCGSTVPCFRHLYRELIPLRYPYTARIDAVPRNRESCTFSSVNAMNFWGIAIFGGIVLSGDGLGRHMGNLV